MADETPEVFTSEKYGFEPFGTLAGVLNGEPVKVMPLGTFYRDERKIVITESDLREIESNFKAGLPRFRVPVNENHQNNGKIGTIKTIEFQAQGADGPGLYASLDLTAEGKDLLARGRYDAVSPEMVWQKAGASYQDPKTNQRFSNVMVGLAVTDRPYFSHEHVALFSATEPAPKRHNGYTKLRDTMRQKFDELMAMVADANEDGIPDAEQAELASAAREMIEKLTVATLDAAGESGPKGAKTMPELEKPTPPAPEQMKDTVSAEEFAAYKAQTEAALAAANKERETFAVKLAEERRTRRLGEIAARVEKFAVVAGDKLAEHLMALEEKAPDEAAFFTALLETLDTQAATADLFKQAGSVRKTAQPESLTELAGKIVVETFGGDTTKFEDALELAGKQRPDLMRAYITAAPRGEN